MIEYCTAVVRGSRGPRAVLNLHLCVRRSGVLGVEMKTLPVNVKTRKKRQCVKFHSVLRVYLP